MPHLLDVLVAAGQSLSSNTYQYVYSVSLALTKSFQFTCLGFGRGFAGVEVFHLSTNVVPRVATSVVCATAVVGGVMLGVVGGGRGGGASGVVASVTLILLAAAAVDHSTWSLLLTFPFHWMYFVEALCAVS